RLNEGFLARDGANHGSDWGFRMQSIVLFNKRSYLPIAFIQQFGNFAYCVQFLLHCNFLQFLFCSQKAFWRLCHTLQHVVYLPFFEKITQLFQLPVLRTLTKLQQFMLKWPCQDWSTSYVFGVRYETRQNWCMPRRFALRGGPLALLLYKLIIPFLP